MADEKSTEKGNGAEAPKATASVPVNEVVMLKKKNSKDKDKSVREFQIAQANALIVLPNSQWVLFDSKYQWNGKEISKK